MVQYSQLKKNTNIRQYISKIQLINKRFSTQKILPQFSIKRKYFDNATQFSQWVRGFNRTNRSMAQLWYSCD